MTRCKNERMRNEQTANGTEFPRGIGNPAARALVAAGLIGYGALSQAREADVLALHGVGPKALGILRAELAERGLSFAVNALPRGDTTA